MKLIHLFGVLLASSTLQAQTLSQTTATASPSPVGYVVGQQDANSRVWQKVTQQTDNRGNITYQTNQSYVELATGLNHLVNGKWVASSEGIEISRDGSSASATNSQHQAYFPGDIFNGVIRLVSSDGKILRSQPIGLNYFDGTNSMLIAVVTNATGAILPSGNQVIYTNAFDGLDADLLYTYTKAGFEQDVILRQQPPDPDSLGLNPATTRLQVLTEFFNPPQHTVTAMTERTVAGDLENDSLSFGAMTMGQGRAFLLGNDSPTVDVNKRWLVIQGRQFLVEEVPIVSVAKAIDTLPPFVGQASANIKPVVSRNLILPPQRLTRMFPKTTFLAKATSPHTGLVLDYQTINGGLTNITFRGDTTYYIGSSLTIYGTNTFEGGAVLKFNHNVPLSMTSPGSSMSVNWQASAYRPVIFTAKDDNSVGESLPFSSGTPSGNYASPALTIYAGGGVQTLAYFRIAYAAQALSIYNGTYNLYHGQIINCVCGIQGVYGATASVRNVLFANVSTNFTDQGGLNLTVQNATFNASTYLLNTVGSGTLPFTNCIFANITSLYSGPYATFSGDHNGFYRSPAFGSNQSTNTTNPFQIVGAGNYYLTNGCNFGNAGTTNIDSVLLAYLQMKTTHPPIWFSNVTIAANTTLNPQAQRDNSSSPDLGYHYDPLDYLVSNVNISATLTLTNGVALGLMGTALTLQTNASLISQGTALVLNHLAHYANVQEQPVYLGGGNMTESSSSRNISASLRFTDISMPAGTNTTSFSVVHNPGGPVSFRDCMLHGLYILLSSPQNNFSVTYTNNLFDRCTWQSSSGNSVSGAFYNNLFRGGSFSLNAIGASGSWPVQDNLFDQANLSGSVTNNLTFSYNGFTLGTTNYLGGTNNETNLVTDYQVGPLGNYYYPTSGTNLATLINAGSTTASALGLYQYTVSTNLVGGYEVPEGTNIVSIGYHYVAVDQYGNPLDSNGDGIPDYLEDANGDGIFDAGDLGNWQGLNLNVIITRPRNGSILP